MLPACHAGSQLSHAHPMTSNVTGTTIWSKTASAMSTDRLTHGDTRANAPLLVLKKQPIHQNWPTVVVVDDTV